jgi:hypothetical protein
MAGLSARAWESALTLGRLNLLAGRWYARLEAAGQLEAVPTRVRDQLWSEHLVAQDRVRMVRFEADRVAHALAGLEIPVVLLKGAAYVLGELPPGEARRVSDVDILVPRADLAAVEIRLQRHGWQVAPHDDYDDHYYRAWMHELPPLQHVARGTTLDVHHTLLPRTDRLCPAPEPLFEAAEPLPGTSLSVLCPADMVLHSILHGFRGGEFISGWRDTLDVHELITCFTATRPGFWPEFAARVERFKATGPAWLALTLAQRLHGTSVPEEILSSWQKRPGRLVRTCVRETLARAVEPELKSSMSKQIALRLLHLRSHLVKMPPGLLLKHLWTKYWRRRRQTTRAGSMPAA